MSPVLTEAYPVHVVNDVTGTRKVMHLGRTRGEAIEGLLWAHQADEPFFQEDEPPVGVCCYIYPDRIVIRFHADPDREEEARAFIGEITGEVAP